MKSITTEQQKQNLQVFASKFSLIVHTRYENDKRKKPKFFLVNPKDNAISSPCFDYDNMNSFLLGINICLHHNLEIDEENDFDANQLKIDFNDFLLKKGFSFEEITSFSDEHFENLLSFEQNKKKFLEFIKPSEKTNVFCLISTSDKTHLELAEIQWNELVTKNCQIAEVTNTNCKRVLIFIDNKWHYLINFDENNFICTINGFLFDKKTYKQTGTYNN